MNAKIDIKTILENPAASLADLESAAAEVQARLNDLTQQNASLDNKARELAAAGLTGDEATAIGNERRGIQEARSAQQALAQQISQRIGASNAKAKRDALSAEWDATAAFLKERDAAIKEADDAILKAAKLIRTAVEKGLLAYNQAPHQPKRDISHAATHLRMADNLKCAAVQAFAIECELSNPDSNNIFPACHRHGTSLVNLFANDTASLLAFRPEGI